MSSRSSSGADGAVFSYTVAGYLPKKNERFLRRVSIRHKKSQAFGNYRDRLVCRIVVHEGVGSGEGACLPGNNTISTINNNNTINTINTKYHN